MKNKRLQEFWDSLFLQEFFEDYIGFSKIFQDFLGFSRISLGFLGDRPTTEAFSLKVGFLGFHL